MLLFKPPPYQVHESFDALQTSPTSQRNQQLLHLAPPSKIISSSSACPLPRPRWRYLLFFTLASFIIWVTVVSPHISIQSWNASTTLLQDSAIVNWASKSSAAALDIKNWLRPNSVDTSHRSDYHDLDADILTPLKTNPFSEDITSPSRTAPTSSSKKILGESSSLLPMSDRIRPKKKPAQRRPELPAFKPRPDISYENVRPSPHELTEDQATSENSRFFTYLPHSGFHNQRIELQNAFQLARLLNRTLILPQLRLGRALAWSGSDELIKTYEREMKNFHFDCIGHKLSSGQSPSTPEECQNYSDWTAVQVDYLMDVQEIVKQQPVVDQLDVRESWFWDALQLNEGDWYSVQDNTRYSYQIFESKLTAKPLHDKYQYRLNVDDLKSYGHVKLLSVGSLFGSNRMILESQEANSWKKKLAASQLPSVPILRSISDQVAQQLGGRGNYIGLHLRVGDLYFRRQAAKSMPKVFEKLCSEVLHLSQEKIDQLVHSHEQSFTSKNGQKHEPRSFLEVPRDSNPKIQDDIQEDHYQSWNQYEDEEDGLIAQADSVTAPSLSQDNIKLEVPLSLSPDHLPLTRRSSIYSAHRAGAVDNMKCRGQLYTDPELQHLNIPIYIATDVAQPMDHIHLSIFFKSFPCVFTLSDLISPEAGTNVRNLENIRSGNDGLKLKHFLTPMLDAIVAAKDTSDADIQAAPARKLSGPGMSRILVPEDTQGLKPEPIILG
ncbi:uncharacterized protein MELLADRAFT_78914 [Melampsora larici-populina 98AG31]|uniref:CigA protein n=1 Tax=Melampsora larici-populina (strain 98AG31 / pathotype 3-4-7) TaxID=747676 RepID=F4S0E8_MELLP|nr:uncharacterized protein MELLADRAFT_78914 [Melampsora larici-populina 98AG31]EGG01951.1 hypothetical protein MELLADRAFT_78914 [Melampsora larici-populina 98AG31]